MEEREGRERLEQEEKETAKMERKARETAFWKGEKRWREYDDYLEHFRRAKEAYVKGLEGNVQERVLLKAEREERPECKSKELARGAGARDREMKLMTKALRKYRLALEVTPVEKLFPALEFGKVDASRPRERGPVLNVRNLIRAS